MKTEKQERGRRRVRRLTALASAALACVLFTAPLHTYAAETLKVPVQTQEISSTSVQKHEAVPMYSYEGRLSMPARLVDGVTYVPFRSFYEAFFPQGEITYDAKTKTARLNGNGLSVSVTAGGHILYANGRCFYTATPFVILSDGRLYVPVRLIAKTLELSVTWNAQTRSVTFGGTPTPLADGATYYDADTLYWLSRIISAESRGEPFLGQVAVGNVVFNRVRSKDFPNTVYGVIFQRNGSVVQFSPVLDGSIYQTPASSSVVAAKVCMEGYTVSDKILFFYAPAVIPTCWASQNRPHAFTIGGHRFYN